MNTDDIIKLAREAAAKHGQELDESPEPEIVAFLVEFHTLVTQAERESRQAAQAENEQLKARLARSGVELRRAVMVEREACAKVCDAFAGTEAHGATIAEYIRARSQAPDCTDCD